MIRLLVMDVDGTLTDGKIYMGENGELMKAFHVRDGCGIKDILPSKGVETAVITARTSGIVAGRCSELNVSYVFQGCNRKRDKLEETAKQLSFKKDEAGIYREIAYIGDDLPDMEAMQICGLKGCPADAVAEIKEIADFVATQNGGEGAVREFIEWIIHNG